MKLGRWRTIGGGPDIRVGVLVVVGVSLMGSACGDGTAMEVDAGGLPESPDAGSEPVVPPDAACGAPAAALDFCQALPTGSVVACSLDANGDSSGGGYLEITLPG